MASLYVNEAKDSNALILDTRKTTPGWRLLEKYAVQCGGARNHRRGLDDMIMIKDNHLASMDGPNRIARAIDLARKNSSGLKIEVEADTVVQARQAADAGADIILLDNMSVDELREAVSVIGNRSQTEASGRININNVQEIARTGVNYISVGAITHSAPAVDVSLEIIK
jgi:nicotinate-nucleotide pyrophosphorylase (carboxylating)